MKKINALRWCAILTLSALILGCQIIVTSPDTLASNSTTSQIRQNIDTSPKSVKVRVLGASIFSLSILTAIIVISSEIRTSRPQKEKILRKYYRS